MIDQNTVTQQSFSKFLSNFKNTLKSVFYEKDDIEQFTQKRGFPALVLRDIMAQNPLSVSIPEQYGGRGTSVKECLGILEAASYESLPLSLTFGINIALFLEPLAKYGQEEVKENIFKRFLTQQNMGGLMITEPNFGSDALNMQTAHTLKGQEYHIKGTKHWQGLTGMADYWLIASRKKDDAGNLGRDIEFFICDVQQPEQHIEVLEYYNNLGLYPIPYGKNKLDIHIAEKYKLQPESTGLKLMMDLLHRSRFQFPGMAMGFIHRMLDEAIKHCNERMVAGKPLLALDQVQHQISRIQSAFTVCSAMCSRSAMFSSIKNNLALAAVEANTMKAYVTDLMQESAQTVLQLFGSKGYKTECVAARGLVDSRPFQIFEGSNEMLYTQITEMVTKLMTRAKTMNLSEFLMKYELTQNVAEHFKSMLNFTVEPNLKQRMQVDLGKILSRVISANMVVEMSQNGFRNDLITNSLDTIKHEIAQLVSSYKWQPHVAPVQEYQDQSNWLNFC